MLYIFHISYNSYIIYIMVGYAFLKTISMITWVQFVDYCKAINLKMKLSLNIIFINLIGCS